MTLSNYIKNAMLALNSEIGSMITIKLFSRSYFLLAMFL